MPQRARPDPALGLVDASRVREGQAAIGASTGGRRVPRVAMAGFHTWPVVTMAYSWRSRAAATAVWA